MLMTVDDVVPAPKIEFLNLNGTIVSTLSGLPGQACSIETSEDLLNWSLPKSIRFTEEARSVRVSELPDAVQFFRITRALPNVEGTPIYFGPTR
jgi:hypothetical protein